MHILIAVVVMLVTTINPKGMISLNVAFSIYYIFCHFAKNMGINSPIFNIEFNQKIYIAVMYAVSTIISITSFFEKE